MEKNIHWFPGHMKKALNEVRERVKIIDVIIEILDARAPRSSVNPLLNELAPHKKRLIVLSKSDYASLSETHKWIEYFNQEGHHAIAVNLLDKNVSQIIKQNITKLGEEKRQKNIKKGMKPQPIKVMIVGIPNVGKSTLINCLAKKRSASVENKPGHTKAQQWIKVSDDFILLDTPGILPSNYENPLYATNLALIGSIRRDILPTSFLCDELIKYLLINNPKAFLTRYNFNVDNSLSVNEIIILIAKSRGYVLNNEPDISRGEEALLDDFKNGRLGQNTLEKVLC